MNFSDEEIAAMLHYFKTGAETLGKPSNTEKGAKGE